VPVDRHEKHRVHTALRKESRDEGGTNSRCNRSELKVAEESPLGLEFYEMTKPKLHLRICCSASVSPYNLDGDCASFMLSYAAARDDACATDILEYKRRAIHEE